MQLRDIAELRMYVDEAIQEDPSLFHGFREEFEEKFQTLLEAACLTLDISSKDLQKLFEGNVDLLLDNETEEDFDLLRDWVGNHLSLPSRPTA